MHPHQIRPYRSGDPNPTRSVGPLPGGYSSVSRTYSRRGYSNPTLPFPLGPGVAYSLENGGPDVNTWLGINLAIRTDEELSDLGLRAERMGFQELADAYFMELTRRDVTVPQRRAS
jgi:hypothetical protein